MKQLWFTLLATVPVLLALDTRQPDRAWNNQGVLYLDHSLNARIHPVPIQAVRVNEGFWNNRLQAITTRGLPTLLQSLEEHGVVDNFYRLSDRPELPRKGPSFSDVELYEWVEAAAWALASRDTADLDRQNLSAEADSLISAIARAQDATGYLDTYFVGDKTRLRLTDTLHSYEDFCLAHLLQAGIAYYRATGDRRLLDVGTRFADYLVDNFGPAKRPFVTGCPDLEMSLVELYRTAGQSKYLEFARYLFSGIERDRLKLKDSDTRYTFSGKPFTARTELEGQTVRALSASAGATDYFTETGDPAYKHTLDLLWTDLTTHKMYINGGVGSRSSDDQFGPDYDLPDDETNAQVCATVANAMWNFRLLALSGDGKYAAVLERALYNGANVGISLSGNAFCARNPLASNGEKLRSSWSETGACTSLDTLRLFESLPGYLYGTSRDGLYVNLYQSSELNWHLQDGTALKVTQVTNYPWSGEVQLQIDPARQADFTLYLRWPSWADAFSLSVNGQAVPISDSARGSFVPLSRLWSRGSSVRISFPVRPVLTVANPRAADLYGRVALQRGPLLYALEQIDQPGAALTDIFIRPGTVSPTDLRKDFIGRGIFLKVPGQLVEKTLSADPLYESMSAATDRARRPMTLTFIPYYATENREPSPMEVWVPVSTMDPMRSSEMLPGSEKGSAFKHLQ